MKSSVPHKRSASPVETVEGQEPSKRRKSVEPISFLTIAEKEQCLVNSDVNAAPTSPYQHSILRATPWKSMSAESHKKPTPQRRDANRKLSLNAQQNVADVMSKSRINTEVSNQDLDSNDNGRSNADIHTIACHQVARELFNESDPGISGQELATPTQDVTNDKPTRRNVDVGHSKQGLLQLPPTNIGALSSKPALKNPFLRGNLANVHHSKNLLQSFQSIARQCDHPEATQVQDRGHTNHYQQEKLERELPYLTRYNDRSLNALSRLVSSQQGKNADLKTQGQNYNTTSHEKLREQLGQLVSVMGDQSVQIENLKRIIWNQNRRNAAQDIQVSLYKQASNSQNQFIASQAQIVLDLKRVVTTLGEEVHVLKKKVTALEGRRSIQTTSNKDSTDEAPDG